MCRDLLGEDAWISQERRPVAAPAIRMEAVDDGHRRPERGALELRGDDGTPPTVQAESPEGDAGGGAIREVGRGAGEAPVPPRQWRPEQADVRVRRPERPAQARLRHGPHCGRGHAGEGGAEIALEVWAHADMSTVSAVTANAGRSTAVVLFTRDLRLHDHPALAAAVERAERVVPLFVLDDAILAGFAAPNRAAFLLDSLHDLDAGLRARGGGLVVRSGSVVGETARLAVEVGAETVYASEDVSAYAQERERRLRQALAGFRIALETFSGVTVVPPGDLAPADSDHYRVFTAFWRRWREQPRRDVLPAPGRIALPHGVDAGLTAELNRLQRGAPAAQLPAGGETAGRRRLDAWLDDGLARYGELADDLAADATSRLSPYLHFGCVSAGEVVARALEREGAEPFVRQLCWRDFNHQLLASRPETAHEDLRPRPAPWRDDEKALEAWRDGRTGYPLVDAGMRQLMAEGFMHNRARLVAGSFLTKDLGIDWRRGAEHFFELLVDGDVANNTGNWQWVAGTGTDSRPNRRLSPERQAERFDPDGVYVRRYIPELGTRDYPSPMAVAA